MPLSLKMPAQMVEKLEPWAEERKKNFFLEKDCLAADNWKSG